MSKKSKENAENLKAECSESLLNSLKGFQELWGEAEYKYYALPISYQRGRGRKPGKHFTPVTGWSRHEITREEYEANVAEGDRDAVEAFMGRLKRNYTSYRRRVEGPGWREKLKAMLEEEVI